MLVAITVADYISCSCKSTMFCIIQTCFSLLHNGAVLPLILSNFRPLAMHSPSFFSHLDTSFRQTLRFTSQLALCRSPLLARIHFESFAGQHNEASMTSFFYAGFVEPLVTAARLWMFRPLTCISMYVTASVKASVTVTTSQFHFAENWWSALYALSL